MRQRTVNIILFLLIVFGTITRLWNIGGELFHTDEQFTFKLAQHSFWYILQFGLSQDCNPPLYYLIDRASMLLVGFSYFGERLPAAIAGVLVIPAVYLLGKEIKNQTLGLLSAFIVTTLGSMWYYSQFGRAYTLVALFFTLALVVYVKLLRGDCTAKNWILFGILASLCLWSHLYAVVPIAVMLVYLWYIYGLKNMRYATVGLIPSLPLIGTYLAITHTRSEIMQGAPGNTPMELLQFMPLEYFGYACGIFALLIIVCLYLNKRDSIIRVLLCVWGVSVIAQCIIATITPVFIRYTLLLVPMLSVIAMMPVEQFIHSDDAGINQKWFVMIVFAVLYIGILVYQATTQYYLPHGSATI